MSKNQVNYTSHPGRIFSLDPDKAEGECSLFFLDDRETYILRAMLAVFPKYYWVWGIIKKVSQWGSVEYETWDNIQSIIETLEVKLIMGCNANDMIAVLEKIALAVGSCSSGGSVSCGVPPDTVIQPVEADAGDSVTQTPPSGFTGNWADYQVHKCKAASMITDDFITTLRSLATINGLVVGMSSGLAYLVLSAALTGSGSSLVASGLLGVIGLGLSATATVAIVITALVGLFFFGAAGLGYLATLADTIEDNRSDFVCAMYTSGSVAEAKQNLAVLLDDFYDVGWSEPLRDLLDTITLNLLSNAVLNLLFEDSQEVLDYGGVADCSECEVTPDYLYSYSSAVAHRDINGGTMYNVTMSNADYAVGAPNGNTASFRGSYYLEVIYNFAALLQSPTITTTATVTTADWRQLWVSSELDPAWDSASWVLVNNSGLNGVASTSVRSVKLKLLGNAGFDAQIALDAVTAVS